MLPSLKSNLFAIGAIFPDHSTNTVAKKKNCIEAELANLKNRVLNENRCVADSSIGEQPKLY